MMNMFLAVCLFGPVFLAELKEVPQEKQEVARNEIRCGKYRDTADKFLEAIRLTENKSFTGGNTKWMRDNLVEYEESDTRFHDVVEAACSQTPKKHDCAEIMDNHEESMKKWFAEKKGTDSVFQDVFVDELKLCCPENYYGADCYPCPIGDNGKVCSGRGQCDGSGTRVGSGECSCNSDSTGNLCDGCTVGFYKDGDKCTNCDKACELGCTGAGGKNCIDNKCAQGYIKKDDACIDKDECVSEYACLENQYCENLPGLYTCLNCHKACNGCSGPGIQNCTKCAEGYILDSGYCDKCHDACDGCKGAGPENCLKCATGFYFDEDEAKCHKCHSSCEQCNGIDSTNCISCPTKFFLDNGSCKKCSKGCRSCNDTEKCLDCEYDYDLDDGVCFKKKSKKSNKKMGKKDKKDKKDKKKKKEQPEPDSEL